MNIQAVGGGVHEVIQVINSNRSQAQYSPAFAGTGGQFEHHAKGGGLTGPHLCGDETVCLVCWAHGDRLQEPDETINSGDQHK